jgi:TolB protein
MDTTTGNGEPRPRRITLTPLSFILILTANLILLLVLAWPVLRARVELPFALPWDAEAAETGAPSPETTATATVSQATSLPLAAAKATATPSLESGFLIVAMREGLDTHLYAYRPLTSATEPIRLTQLTASAWDDTTPALSPDGTKLAFASNRSGQWQIYVWELDSGEITALTDAPGYKAAPTWSPDGLWIAYERYYDTDLEITIQEAKPGADPIRLTENRAADSAPVWSPAGRVIAFVSTRGGREQIWLADLDRSGEDRLTALDVTGEDRAKHPTWTSDGHVLAWASVGEDGLHRLYSWDSREPDRSPRPLGNGDLPAWNEDASVVYTTVLSPDQTYLTAYTAAGGDLLLPLLALPGQVESMAWVDISLYDLLSEEQAPTATPLWQPELNPDADSPGRRWGLVELEDVEAPNPQLHDRVDEAFRALREKVAQEAGWDALSNLQEAYVPLTSSLAPGMQNDWLYTGRAFALNPLPINAGWMAVVRQDFGPETHWRLYLRTRFQDGSQGRPLRALPWNFNARFQGEPQPYEQGGARAETVPPGYWLDFTELAAAYGWEQLPALSNWRSVYSAARFNEFVRRDGLAWREAMLELYPPEILVTPTPIPTATNTPTVTATATPTITPTPYPPGYQTPTPTPSPTPTASPTATSFQTEIP